MILLIAIVLVSVGTALVFSIYSIFNPFIENLSDIRDYNSAYYWAMASIERANLALKYRDPWFQGSWWWIWDDDFWEESDHRHPDYWILAHELSDNWTYWEIESLSSWRIPEWWEWNVEAWLQYTWTDYWWPSENYNMMGYDRVEEFNFFEDTSDDNIYEYWTESTQIIDIHAMSWHIRINPLLYNRWWWDPDALLCEDCDFAWDWIDNDLIVSWSLDGREYDDWEAFSIIPNVAADYSWSTVLSGDSLIRRDIINRVMEQTSNDNKNIHFWENKNPLNDSSIPNLTPDRSDTQKWHSTMPNNHALSGSDFVEIFQEDDEDLESLKMRMFIANILETNDWNVYPFLEYKFDFLDSSNNLVELPSRNYDIRWVGIVGDYKVEILQTRPTSDWTYWWDFVILF